jgi:hypothetical protein
VLYAGDTFLLPKRIEWADHLWIVLLDPEPSGDTIIVNLTSREPHHQDFDGVLNVGDHPFVKRESVINYADSLITDANLIEQTFPSTLGSKHSPCSPALLARVQKGLLDSRFTPGKIEDYFRIRQGL